MGHLTLKYYQALHHHNHNHYHNQILLNKKSKNSQYSRSHHQNSIKQQAQVTHLHQHSVQYYYMVNQFNRLYTMRELLVKLIFSMMLTSLSLQGKLGYGS